MKTINRNAYWKLWYSKNKEKRKAYSLNYHNTHKEYCKKYGKEYYKQFRDIIFQKARLKKQKGGWKPREIIKGQKICRFCKKPSEYLTDCHNGYYICRDCNTIRCRKYRKSADGLLSIKKAIIKSSEKYPEKQKARLKVWVAKSKGLIIKPKQCVVCNSIAEIFAHHKDYKKPLDVVWVCRNCHIDLHKQNQTCII